MSRSDKDPAQAEAQISETNEAVRQADDALADAIERQEAIEAEMDSADDSGQAALSERHQALDVEIEGLRQDLDSAEKLHGDNQTFWFDDDDDDDDDEDDEDDD